MPDKRWGSIFDEAGKHPSKKKKHAPPPPAAPPTRPAPKEGGADPEVLEMLARLREMDEDLQRKMNRLTEISGLTPKQIEKFGGNPSNFSVEQWAKLQKEKEELENKIYNIVGKQAKTATEEKKTVKIAKERQGKTLGARKGWIQMH